MKAVWETIKASLKEQMSESGFHLWIEPLQVEPEKEDELILVCPNPFALRWIKSNYLQIIRWGAKQVSGLNPGVRLTVSPTRSRPQTMLPWPKQPQLPLGTRDGLTFNSSFTFEQFVVGSSNRLACQASQAMARNDTLYNRSLFLNSGPGLGKSHLSQAVGNFLTQTWPPGQILYLSAENFTNEMVAALRSGQMTSFKERFRKCEVLMLEEVQFFGGKEKIQAEVCYTLDSLMTRNKRVVFTSCYLPGEISHLSQELRSRLTGGVIAPIGPPDFPTRVQILQKKAETRGIQISVKILEYLAEHIVDDVRRL